MSIKSGHMHTCTEKNLQGNPLGWMVMGNIEVDNLMEDLNPTIQGESIDIKIFKDIPNVNFNN